jgi:hypothetical protein
MARYEMNLEYLCEIEAHVGGIPVGPSSWGIRIVAPVVDGTIEGPRIKGKFLPVGGDWAVIRADNTLEVDVRAVIQTDDGAFIYTHYHGVSDMTQEEVDAFLQRGEVAEGASLYVTPRFETSHENYLWLARVQAVGRGGLEQEGDKIKVTYSGYVLTE